MATPLAGLVVIGRGYCSGPLSAAFRVFEGEGAGVATLVRANAVLTAEGARPLGLGLVVVAEDFGELFGELSLKKILVNFSAVASRTGNVDALTNSCPLDSRSSS
jgi:hypothetical protein